MRSKRAIGGLILFTYGMFFVPALHWWRLSRPGGNGTSACRACVYQVSEKGFSREKNSRSAGRRGSGSRHHDPSTCSICRFAKLPINAETVHFDLPRFSTTAVVRVDQPDLPDFKSPRLLPFACGPPS
jgi:hypothetical protein